ncbi:YaaC family protein [Neobacillus mesonae]|uniref:YaaC family protein n=1 Tax=Neobacillus mesonae TaxID=1193713 RepID=UPI00203C1FF2|nr:YaaC family protein [Neobacillus mesonae]MCM3571378.1 YaaC family protein [Neobacillus mesonae]
MNYNKNGWKSFTCFFSAEYCQKYLKSHYIKGNVENPEVKSYENCYSFLYYLEHGQIYYQQAEKAPLILKPILLFYGLVHLIKACILTIDPAYPESTTVLAHGVSTRKRKKQNYLFFNDEVKIQKNGLFPYMSEKMFHMKQLEGEKIMMKDLLQLIPELDGLFLLHEDKKIFEKPKREGELFVLSDTVLDFYHMTENRFKEFIVSKVNQNVEFSGNGIRFKLQDHGASTISPLKFNLEEDDWVFPLHRNEIFTFPELLTHYLLLYNLSMIARYETEWWSELTKTMPNRDYPFIHFFLDVTLKKGPFLVYQYLTDSDS